MRSLIFRGIASQDNAQNSYSTLSIVKPEQPQCWFEDVRRIVRSIVREGLKPAEPQDVDIPADRRRRAGVPGGCEILGEVRLCRRSGPGSSDDGRGVSIPVYGIAITAARNPYWACRGERGLCNRDREWFRFHIQRLIVKTNCLITRDLCLVARVQCFALVIVLESRKPTVQSREFSV